MKRKTFILALLVLFTAALSNAAERPEARPATPAATTTNAPSVQVIAYYFPGTVRCVECLKTERQARDVIEDTFKAEVAARRLVFKLLNYDLPENVRFGVGYKLPYPSLVIVRRNSGKDEKWKLLDDTWQLIGDTAKFNRYVEEEIAKYLKNVK